MEKQCDQSLFDLYKIYLIYPPGGTDNHHSTHDANQTFDM